MKQPFLKTNQRVKNFMASQHIILMLCWLVLTLLFIAGLVLFIIERTNANNNFTWTDNVSGITYHGVNSLIDAIKTGVINNPQQIQNAYQAMMGISYPLIDFSLFSFGILSLSSGAGITDWVSAWTQRQTNIDMAYSYVFITALIAVIALIFHIIVISKLSMRERFEKKYNLANRYPNDYAIFSIKMYLDFIANFAILFSFFNFLTTIISLIYGVFLVLISYILWWGFKRHTEILTPHRWWKATNFAFFTTILLIQNLLSILKIVFMKQFNVNLDLVLQLVFPIGTITIFITAFIRNMLSSKVTAVNNTIKGIKARIAAFRVFYYTRREKALEDYTFVSQLPIMIKNPMADNKIDLQEGLRLMTLVDETIKFLTTHIKNGKELNYLLYRLFNVVTDEGEIAEVEANVLKLEKELKPSWWAVLKSKY